MTIETMFVLPCHYVVTNEGVMTQETVFSSVDHAEFSIDDCYLLCPSKRILLLSLEHGILSQLGSNY